MDGPACQENAVGAKKDRKPNVILYGDDGEPSLADLLRTLLAGHDIRLETAVSVEELQCKAPDAALILIRTAGENDPHNDLARLFMQEPRVVADIVALTGARGIEERLRILASGFDAIFNTDFFDYPELRNILMHRVEKGFTGLENRIQQEEYRRFKAALSASPDAFIVFDENRRLFFVSEHYRKAYPLSGSRFERGLDVMDAFDMCCAEQDLPQDDPQYLAMREFWTALEGEADYIMQDGRIWHMKARKLPDGQGTIVTTADISRYRQQQLEMEENTRRLSEALEKEQEAGAIQKQFISMVSHEFRTPLSIIDGNAQILSRRARTIDEGSIQKRAKTIRNAVSRLVNMMEGVLSSNMLRTGNLTVLTEPVDIKKLIRELCDEYTDLASTHAIACDIDALPDCVNLDRKLITLALGNFLSNAIKFTKERPQIIVRGRMEEGGIVIRMEDNGIGIPPNELSRIFDRYYRTTTASGIPGTGIGLSLARDLIGLHGGTVAVESEMGKGTAFTITLPLQG